MLYSLRTIQYVSFDYEKDNQIGISFGMLNSKKGEFYIKAKANKELFSRGGILYTTDNSGYTSNSNTTIFSGDVQHNNWSFLLGITVKIYSPAWFYIGAGALNSGQYFHGIEYNSNGDYLKDRWMKNTDQQSTKFVGEGGIIVNVLNRGVIKVGATYYDTKIVPQFGIGFGW